MKQTNQLSRNILDEYLHHPQIFTSKIADNCFRDPTLCQQGEVYPSLGRYITKEEIHKCFNIFEAATLLQRWDCIHKALYANAVLRNEERGDMYLIIGSLWVISPSTNSSYGFAYNPPFEIHAWLHSPKQDVIYDLALPGVILTGLSLKDEMGPYLSDIHPAVYSDKPNNHENIIYHEHERHDLRWAL